MSTARRRYEQLRIAVGAAAQMQREAFVMIRFGVSRKFVRYWRARFADPWLHSGGWGGYRHSRYTAIEQLYVEAALWFELERNALRTHTELRSILIWQYGVSPSVSWYVVSHVALRQTESH